ncbi:MAG: hypothetical protein ACOCP4_00670 [Candidatus Woesearchaeota archaeon]
MKPITHEEARNKICPFSLKSDNVEYCFGTECMCWKEINPRIEREDHSGGKEMMLQKRNERGFQEIKREGPHNSLGVLILEAQGVCELIDKER